MIPKEPTTLLGCLEEINELHAENIGLLNGDDFDGRDELMKTNRFRMAEVSKKYKEIEKEIDESHKRNMKVGTRLFPNDDRHQMIDKAETVFKWFVAFVVFMVIAAGLGLFVSFKMTKSQMPGSTHILNEAFHSINTEVEYNVNQINGDTLLIHVSTVSTYYYKGLTKEKQKALLKSLDN